MSLDKYRKRILISRLPSPLIAVAALVTVFLRLAVNRKIVVILSPGKVGSGSLYNYLRKETSWGVFHIHYLSRERIMQEFKRVERKAG